MTLNSHIFKMQNCEPRKGRPKVFGEIHDNYNWIECASVKNPNKNYFFNVRSHCRTWTRPVPENVDLPFYDPHLVASQASDNKNEPTPPVSELDEDNEENEEPEDANQNEERFFEIACKIYYHGARNSRHSRRSRRKILENISEEDSELCETTPVTDFLELQYLSEDSAKRLRSASSSSSESSQESNIESTKASSSSCHCSCCGSPKGDSDSASRSYESSTSYQSFSSNFSAPRLKEITYSDLITEPKKKWRRRKKCKIDPSKDEKKLRLTPEKIICDMHGIRTISYDPIFEFINPILPPDVLPSRLTDCSSVSSEAGSPVLNNPIKRLDDLPLHIRDPILSEVSSGSESHEPIEQFNENFKEMSLSKTIGEPCAQRKKSYEDILSGKMLCIKLWRIDLDKDYLRWKNKNDDKKKELKTVQKEETEESEIEKREENSEKESFTENSESCTENSESCTDSKVKRRYPRRKYRLSYPKMYAESDTESEEIDFGFVCRDFKLRKNRKEKAQKGKKPIKSISETKYSEIEERCKNRGVEEEKSFAEANLEREKNFERETCVEQNFERDLNSEKEENSKREDSEIEYSEREDESDQHSKKDNDENISYEEENSSVGWVIVNSQVNKIVLKKFHVNSESPMNVERDASKTDLEEKRITEETKTERKSEVDIVPDKVMEDLRIEFEKTEDKTRSFGAKDLDVRADTFEDFTLRENIEIRANPLEFLNNSSTQRELTLSGNIQILKPCFSQRQAYSQELGEKIEEVNKSQTKSQEIKNQEDEFQNVEQPMDVDEEEELLLFLQDKQKEIREETKVDLESANKAPENMAADEKIEDVRVDSERKEDKIRSFEVNNSERPAEIVQNLTLVTNTETKSNALHFFNSCRLTARELTLNEKIEHLKSGVFSLQTDFEELRDKIEEVNKSQTKSQEIKSQEYEFPNGEKAMDVDEEELLLSPQDKHKETREEPKVDLESAQSDNKAPENMAADEKIKDVRVDSDRKEDQIRSFEINNSERPAEIVQNLTLATNTETKSNALEFFNSCTLTARELTLDGKIKQTKSQEIKSQEYEFRNGEKPMDVDEEELLLSPQDKHKKSREEPKVDLESAQSANKAPENMAADEKIKDVRVDSDRKEDKIRSFEINNSERPADIVQNLTLIKNTEMKSNALEFFNSCTLTARELTLDGKIEQTKSQEIKSQEYEFRNGEKPMDVDEEERLLLEGDTIDDDQLMDEDALLNGEGSIEGDKSINLEEEELLLNEKGESPEKEKRSTLPGMGSEEELLGIKNQKDEKNEELVITENINELKVLPIESDNKDGELTSVAKGSKERELIETEKEEYECPGEKPIDSGNREDKSKSLEVEKELNLSDKRNEEEFFGIEKRNDERNEELVIIDNRDKPGFLLIESVGEEKELIRIGEGIKKRDLSATEKEKNKNVIEKPMDVHTVESSESDCCSTVLAEILVWSDSETVIDDYISGRALTADESDDSDKTQVISDSESD